MTHNVKNAHRSTSTSFPPLAKRNDTSLARVIQLSASNVLRSVR